MAWDLEGPEQSLPSALQPPGTPQPSQLRGCCFTFWPLQSKTSTHEDYQPAARSLQLSWGPPTVQLFWHTGRLRASSWAPCRNEREEQQRWVNRGEEEAAQVLLSKASEDAAGGIWGSWCTSNTLELSSCSCKGNTTQGLTGVSSLVGTPRGPSGDEGGGEAAPPGQRATAG